MNFVDALIILLVILAVFRGARIGILNLAFSAAGFIIGLYLGSLLAGVIGNHITGVDRLLVAILIALLAAFAVAGIGEAVGSKLSAGIRRIHLGPVNSVLGSVFEAAFMLLVIWLVGSVLSNVHHGNLGAAIQRSAVLSTINRQLPAPPDFLSELGRLAGANGFPKVFIHSEPTPQTVTNTATIDTPAVRAAEKSVVKINGVGCGGVLKGSGFAIRPDIIATNAHVIAGISRPNVIINGRYYGATPIWFDQDMDFALLRLTGTTVTPLTLTTAAQTHGTTVVVMGYPGNGPLVVGNAVILGSLNAVGRNIYDRGLVNRQIYEVQADVEPGSSGGPLVDSNGTVVGVIFAKSVTNNFVGYALQIPQLESAIAQSETQQAPIATGRCATG